MATLRNPAVSDQKKRTLEALERRFTLAKSQLKDQEEKTKKQSSQDQKPEEEQEKQKTGFSSPLPTHQHEPKTSSVPTISPFCLPSSKKQDPETDGPVYFPLPQTLHENLFGATGRTQIISRRGRSVADKIVNELLHSGDSSQKYAQGSKSMKIDNWLLLDNRVHGCSASADARARAILRSHSKRSKVHMSKRQHKKFGSFDLPREFHNFDLFKPVHEMWKDYISELLKNVRPNQLSQCLLTADLHGAILSVVECRITSFTGVCGIMVRETVGTFGIIMQDNRFQVVPKRGSVFMFQASCWKITLLGDKLSLRTTGH